MNRTESDFYGMPTDSEQNQHLRLDYLTSAGPRIVRAFPAGIEENILVEVPDFGWETPYGRFNIRGGHRLWAAPEKPEITYAPDNEPVEMTKLKNGVRLSQNESAAKIAKTIEIQLDEGRSAATLHHRLENLRTSSIEVAAWAITQLPPGGWGFIPQVQGKVDEHGYLPNRSLALWPYTNWDDPRLNLAEDFLFIESRSSLEQPFKIGTLNQRGWAGYLRNGVLFRKRFSAPAEAKYPDFDCNTEIYTNHRFLELETLGPLTILEPGQSLVWEETWEFFTGLPVPTNLDELRELIRSIDKHPE